MVVLVVTELWCTSAGEPPGRSEEVAKGPHYARCSPTQPLLALQWTNIPHQSMTEVTKEPNTTALLHRHTANPFPVARALSEKREVPP